VLFWSNSKPPLFSSRTYKTGVAPRGHIYTVRNGRYGNSSPRCCRFWASGLTSCDMATRLFQIANIDTKPPGPRFFLKALMINRPQGSSNTPAAHYPRKLPRSFCQAPRGSGYGAGQIPLSCRDIGIAEAIQGPRLQYRSSVARTNWAGNSGVNSC